MITVERATLEHLKLLNDLMQRQFEEHEIVFTADILATTIQVMLEKPNLGCFLIAKEMERVIGFAAISFTWTLEHGGKSAWLDELYILPEDRNRGAGSALVEFALEEVGREGCQAIDLEVEEDHQRAERLYKRKGFKRLQRSRWVRPLYGE